MPQLLIELFSEEIPARMQGQAARDLERMASERLKAAGLTWEALTTYAGPRRLTLVVEGLPAATPDREEEVKGPRTSAPEQALDGFLRKTGLVREQLTERDGVWCAVIASKGARTTDLVPEMVDQIVRGFPWPKSMRWGTGSLRWVRPLKRITALFDGAVVPFGIDGIVSGDVTEGHRFLGSGRPFAVKDFADYRAKLEREFVLLDAADRRLRVLEGARAVCAARGLALVDDDGLLEEVAGLAEWPTPILGEMDPSFLDLPPEVIRLSMKVHQKYFAVRRSADIQVRQTAMAEGADREVRAPLAPHFVVVANVEASDGGAALAAGNSRVLSARLNDARFFWDEDLKTGFEVWARKLEGVTFHAKLGTMAQRVERIAALAREIAPLVGADADQAEAAARLAKGDLASAMVGEFPELQGVMGGYYAAALDASSSLLPSPLMGEGSTGEVAAAVRDHYRPQGPNDTVPTAPVTVAVALADKLDTLVGFFAIDEKPTGSKDPFALRRAALGVIRLVLENGVRMSLSDICEMHRVTDILRRDPNAKVHQDYFNTFGNGPGAIEMPVWLRPFAGRVATADAFDADNPPAVFEERASVGNDVSDFIIERLKVSLRDRGISHDMIDAGSFSASDDDLVRIVRRVEALDGFLATDDGANLLAGSRRAANILRAEEKKGPLPTGMVDLNRLVLPQEQALAFAVQRARGDVEAALEGEDFAAAMTALARLRGPVDAFFEGVMVNSDVAEERENRLKLLGQVRDVMGRVADFGMIAG